MMEKTAQTLPTTNGPAVWRQESRRRWSGRVVMACIAMLAALYTIQHHSGVGSALAPYMPGPSLGLVNDMACPQPNALFPSGGSEKMQQMQRFVSSAEFERQSIRRLSGAVQVATQSFDDMGAIGDDPRWDVMYDFATYLRHTFPTVHDKLRVEVVNTHGLVFTWAGSDAALKPTLLLAHQDVVPVPNATLGDWTHPPFAGVYDGDYIWGRGASDCKNQLIAILEVFELLLAAEYEPQRTIIAAFGFDEEISGREGAGHLAPFLLHRYGKDSVAVIVDEGTTYERVWGTTFAKPGVGEKGYTDVTITIRMSGGHSSIPPDHTSIGVLSELVTKIEAERYPTYLDDKNPYLGQLICGAAHSPAFPPMLKRLLGQHSTTRTCGKHDLLADEAAKAGLPIRYLMQTSQAVDIIAGGVKVNALPERASVVVNHRVNVGETPAGVWQHLTRLAEPLARKYNLTVHAFDGEDEQPLSISLSASDMTLQVAPVSPTHIDGPYGVLAGTIRALYGEDMVVAPGIITGYTDTRYYWDITQHIFRFYPGYDPRDDGLVGFHTVNERVSVKNHVNTVKWIGMFVRNMDEADLE